jgi:hypothetical protein
VDLVDAIGNLVDPRTRLRVGDGHLFSSASVDASDGPDH